MRTYKRCPNCETEMDEKSICPECDHDETGCGCSCDHCLKGIDTEEDDEPE